MTSRHWMWALLLAAMFHTAEPSSGSVMGPPSPSCTGLPDGLNADPSRKWSPYFIVCRAQQLVDSGICPRDPTLTITRLFHADEGHCVTPYEIPKAHSSYSLSCQSKADGLHLDDVSQRPYVYFRCFDGKLISVHRCAGNQYFDEAIVTCSAKPMFNSIMHHGLMNKTP